MTIIDMSDDQWMWVHQKYGMSRIMRKLYSLKKTDLTLMLLTIVNQIDETMKLMAWNSQTVHNDGDDNFNWTNEHAL